MALPFYRQFILGWFSRYIDIIIPLIAIAQFFIGMGMLLHGWWVKWACIGAIFFLVSIAPLAMGSGFPFPLVVRLPAFIVLKKDNRELLWRKPKLSGGINRQLH
jgi:hypothetical protein